MSTEWPRPSLLLGKGGGAWAGGWRVEGWGGSGGGSFLIGFLSFSFSSSFSLSVSFSLSFSLSLSFSFAFSVQLTALSPSALAISQIRLRRGGTGGFSPAGIADSLAAGEEFFLFDSWVFPVPFAPKITGFLSGITGSSSHIRSTTHVRTKAHREHVVRRRRRQ